MIRIEAVADPSPPTITEEDLRRDTAAEIDRLVEAMDQVYRKVVIHVCNPCYRQWIENPAAL